VGNKLLRISSDLSLPLDAVTQTFGILAKKRRGKTYTASVMGEEMIKAKLPFAVLDPTGAWWGLRASADGKREGYPVVIIGGDHGDIPLEPTAGAVIADLVVEHPGWYVVDMSAMNSNAEQDRFAMEFGERLYRAKNKHRFPMHLFIDEADAFLPQQPMPEQRRMLGAYDTIVRRGGIRGIGVSLISQRPAVVNKNVLSQVECLIVLQILGAHDRAAIESWVKQHGAKKDCAALMDSLASLGLGEAWFWSPAWLDVFKKTQVRKRETFNSSKTPEVGEHQILPKVLAKVDLDQIRLKVSETIERVKADDPKELRKQIAELQKQMAAKQPAAPAESAPVKIEKIKVPTIGKRAQVGLTKAANQIRKAISRLQASQSALDDALVVVDRRVGHLIQEIGNKCVANAHLAEPPPRGSLVRVTVTPPKSARAVTIPAKKPWKTETAVTNGAVSDGLSHPQQRILGSLAAFYRLDVHQVKKEMLAVHSGASPRSSAYTNNLGRLRTLGLIDYPSDGYAGLTAAGHEQIDSVPVIESLAELHESWYRILPRPQADILRVACEAYPGSVEKVYIASAVNVSASSSAYTNNLGRLRTLGAITYPASGHVRASDLLFPEALR